MARSLRRAVAPGALLLFAGCGGDLAPVGGAGSGSGGMGTLHGSTGAPPRDLPSPAPDVAPACTGPEDAQEAARELIRAGQARDGQELPACTRHRWWTTAPSATAHRVRVSSASEVRVEVRYPDDPGDGPPLAAAEGAGEVELMLYAPRSGEFAILVQALDPTLPATYAIDVTCTADCERETTRFPVLFVHGWTGFGAIGPVDYFFGVRDELEPLGYPVVFPVLDPYNSHIVRADQLAAAIDAALLELRARKVNLLAHSQGGLDARYLISTLGYGDRVAALTTVATPHQGTPLADIALGLQPGPTGQALAFLLELVGAAAGNQSDAEASFWSLSETFVRGEFNPQNPDDPRVDYQSWMGRTCLSVLACGDAVDAPILTGYQILTSVAGDNDGVVPVSSAPWGAYHGTVPADHFDEVGQVAGATSPEFDHLAFYRDRARDLRDAGH